MFEDSLIESGGRLKTSRGWTSIVSFMIQIGIVGVMVLVVMAGCYKALVTVSAGDRIHNGLSHSAPFLCSPGRMAMARPVDCSA